MLRGRVCFTRLVEKHIINKHQLYRKRDVLMSVPLDGKLRERGWEIEESFPMQSLLT